MIIEIKIKSYCKIDLYMLYFNEHAGVAELVDALDLGSSGENRRGSTPFIRTILQREIQIFRVI